MDATAATILDLRTAHLSRELFGVLASFHDPVTVLARIRVVVGTSPTPGVAFAFFDLVVRAISAQVCTRERVETSIEVIDLRHLLTNDHVQRLRDRCEGKEANRWLQHALDRRRARAVSRR